MVREKKRNHPWTAILMAIAALAVVTAAFAEPSFAQSRDRAVTAKTDIGYHRTVLRQLIPSRRSPSGTGERGRSNQALGSARVLSVMEPARFVRSMQAEIVEKAMASPQFRARLAEWLSRQGTLEAAKRRLESGRADLGPLIVGLNLDTDQKMAATRVKFSPVSAPGKTDTPEPADYDDLTALDRIIGSLNAKREALLCGPDSAAGKIGSFLEETITRLVGVIVDKAGAAIGFGTAIAGKSKDVIVKTVGAVLEKTGDITRSVIAIGGKVGGAVGEKAGEVAGAVRDKAATAYGTLEECIAAAQSGLSDCNIFDASTYNACVKAVGDAVAECMEAF